MTPKKPTIALVKRLEALDPDGKCAFIVKEIRRAFGDDIENMSQVKASRGMYIVNVETGGEHPFVRRVRTAKQLAEVVMELRALGRMVKEGQR